MLDNLVVVALGLYFSPTAKPKVIRRQGLGFKIHLKD